MMDSVKKRERKRNVIYIYKINIKRKFLKELKIVRYFPKIIFNNFTFLKKINNLTIF